MAQGESKSKKLDPKVLIALGVFFFALAIRLMGIGWGLKNDLHNASYHPDEPVVFGFSRAIQPERGQFVPPAAPTNFYSYGTLYITLLRIASDMTTTYTGGPKVQGDGFSWSNPTKTDWDWVSRCHAAGRWISALAGAGTCLVVFLFLRRFVGQIAGLVGAAMLALAPGHVVHSRFQTVDILATFFLALSLYYSSSIVKSEDSGEVKSILKIACLAGLFAGLSAGTKYTGIIAVLPLLVVLPLFDSKKWMIPALAGVGVALLAFVLTTPGVLLDTARFVEGVKYEMVHTATGQGLVFTGTPNGFFYTITNLMFGIGPLPVILGVGGVCYGAYRKHRWAIVLLAFSIPYYLLISRSEVKFLRYSFPLDLAIVIGFGYLVQIAHVKGGTTRILSGLGILGLGGIPFGGLATTVLMTKAMIDEDPRDQAARYMKAQSGTVGYPVTPWFWSAPIFADSADPLSVSMTAKSAMAQNQGAPLVLDTDPSGNVVSWSQKLEAGLIPNFISYSSFNSFPIERLQGRKDLGVQQPELDTASAFLKGLSANYVQDKSFGNPILGGSYPDMLPEDLLYTNPVVYIWKKKS